MIDPEAVQRFRAEVVGKRNLPTIPAVLSRILALVDGEATSARDLVEVIERDQALTGRTLRLANSAFFGQQRRVATIPRALLVLGFSTVRNLALGVKVWESLAGGVARQRVEELWGHAVTVGFVARRLAGAWRTADPDECFTAGLLHDVGRIVIAGRFGQEYWQAVNGPSAVPLDAREREAFGVDHAEVGGWLLEAWNLPPTIVEAVREHHEAQASEGLPVLLSLVNRLVGLTDVPSGAVGPEGQALLASLGDRGLTLDRWQELVAELRTQDGLGRLGAA